MRLDHGRARRFGHGDPAGEGLPSAENDDRDLRQVRQARRGGDADAREHDHQSAAHARRVLRRRQRRARRVRRGHAVRGKCRRQVAQGGRRDHVAHLLRGRRRVRLRGSVRERVGARKETSYDDRRRSHDCGRGPGRPELRRQINRRLRPHRRHRFIVREVQVPHSLRRRDVPPRRRAVVPGPRGRRQGPPPAQPHALRLPARVRRRRGRHGHRGHQVRPRQRFARPRRRRRLRPPRLPHQPHQKHRHALLHRRTSRLVRRSDSEE
mmetsp:Transcript_29899/g.91560  ORF Transcript_29899/g.91560 Transcript_29899/m.91560 type:complete len:266 (-) Transcript_29899:432-1229(-)